MVEDNYKTERCRKPLNAPAKKPFFFYYIIIFIKSQVNARLFDIFYYLLYNYNGKKYIL
jgi:hypothetical protein